jgi:hypothetical protein
MDQYTKNNVRIWETLIAGRILTKNKGFGSIGTSTFVAAGVLNWFFYSNSAAWLLGFIPIFTLVAVLCQIIFLGHGTYVAAFIGAFIGLTCSHGIIVLGNIIRSVIKLVLGVLIVCTFCYAIIYETITGHAPPSVSSPASSYSSADTTPSYTSTPREPLAKASYINIVTFDYFADTQTLVLGVVGDRTMRNDEQTKPVVAFCTVKTNERVGKVQLTRVIGMKTVDPDERVVRGADKNVEFDAAHPIYGKPIQPGESMTDSCRVDHQY